MSAILSREFDSRIFKKVIAGRIKPAFFMSNFSFWYVLVCNSVVYLNEQGLGGMNNDVTDSKNNNEVYIYKSYRKKDEKSSSRI